MLSDRIKLASPCPMKWSEMTGDDRVRYCGACKLSVYNAAALTTNEIEALFRPGERTCMVLYRRRDGTLVTGDCSRLWAERKAAAQSLLTEGMSVLGIVVALCVIAICLITIFGDNIRAYFGSSAGGIVLTPSPSAPAVPSAAKKPLRDFGAGNVY